MRKYEKYVGIAFLLIGFILGIEGIITTFTGFWIFSWASNALEAAMQDATFFEDYTNLSSVFQTVQAIFSVVVLYGIGKTAVGIFCIALGMKTAFGKAKS